MLDKFINDQNCWVVRFRKACQLGEKSFYKIENIHISWFSAQQIFFSTTSFSNCGYEILTTRKIRLTLHDLPEILQRSA